MPQGQGRFRHVIELSLLRSVRPDLLLEFLQPFATDLAAAGLPLPGKAPSTAWLVELTATMNRDGTDLPAGLQAALADIADLATPVGHEQIMTLAEQRRIALVRADEAVPQEDLAFFVYLKDQRLFRAARSRIRFFEARLFAEYQGDQRNVSLEARGADARLAVLCHRLGDWLSRRNRTHLCRVWAHDLQDQIVFLIAHGSHPTRVSDLAQGTTTGATHIPEQHDIVVLDKVEDRLSVSARFPSERELYRAVFGFVLFLDEGHFRVVRLYHSRPFRERGSLALDVTGLDDVERVTLRRLTVLSSDKLHSKLEFASDDLREWLDTAKVRTLLRQQAIGSWTFGIGPRHHARLLDVEVWPPNQVRIDRRLHVDLVHRFLRAKGFEYRPSDSHPVPSSR